MPQLGAVRAGELHDPEAPLRGRVDQDAGGGDVSARVDRDGRGLVEVRASAVDRRAPELVSIAACELDGDPVGAGGGVLDASRRRTSPFPSTATSPVVSVSTAWITVKPCGAEIVACQTVAPPDPASSRTPPTPGTITSPEPSTAGASAGPTIAGHDHARAAATAVRTIAASGPAGAP